MLNFEQKRTVQYVEMKINIEMSLKVALISKVLLSSRDETEFAYQGKIKGWSFIHEEIEFWSCSR